MIDINPRIFTDNIVISPTFNNCNIEFDWKTNGHVKHIPQFGIRNSA